MSNVAKLKKKAAEFEQKKQFDKALALYVQILDSTDDREEEPDVALYNRVGDLMLRQGSVGDAVTYYEKAVDLYAESGFFNNAIALCNKILRHSPGRNSIYYKLGKISAKKGFKSDAKQNFLEYADRMQKGGQIDEAFRALKEFADLCPDQDDIRLMLAEQLAKKNRKGEAMEQLQSLYDKFESEGRKAEARATVDRMKAIDPLVEPKHTGAQPRQKGGELVFLDLSYDEPAPGATAPAKPPPRATVPLRPPADLPPERPPAARAPLPPAIADLPLLEAFEDPAGAVEDIPSLLEPTEFDATDVTASAGALDGLLHGAEIEAEDEELEDADLEDADPVGIPGLEPTSLEDGEETSLDEDLAPLSGREFAELPLTTPADSPAAVPEHDLALPGDLPLLDVLEEDAEVSDEPIGGELPLILPDESPEEQAHVALEELSPPITRGASAPGERATTSLELEPTRSDAETLLPGYGSDLPLLDVGTELEREEDSPTPLAGLSSSDSALDLQQDLGDEAYRPRDLPAAASIPDESVAPEGIEPAVLAALADATAATPPGVGDALVTTPPPATGDAASGAPEGATMRRRPSRSVLALSVDRLREQVEDDDGNWSVRRQLGEAMLEAGDRPGGLHELELAMIGFERANDLENARSVTDAIIRLDPNSVRHHQKRVEYAFRTNDKARLAEAYLELADALFRSGQPEKARAVYQRVLDLAPDDIRAQAALSAFVDPAATPSKKERERAADREARPTTTRKRYTAQLKPSSAEESAPPESMVEAAFGGAAGDSDDDFINLGDWLRDEEAPKSTRMVVGEEAPSGDEQADFNDMLRKFKQGVAENVEEEDHESHYDLGVAYKEMGLLDEAIAEFQKALRGPSHRVRTYEALGQCFLEKKQFNVAVTILQRALGEQAPDDQLVGVLYLLGYASEALHRPNDAVQYYHRVFAVDIQFRDVGARLNALEKTAGGAR